MLQQFDGVILGPKILGDSIGVKPLAVIFAIIVGGAVAGALFNLIGISFNGIIGGIICGAIGGCLLIYIINKIKG